jgi:hypothetical protein
MQTDPPAPTVFHYVDVTTLSEEERAKRAARRPDTPRGKRPTGVTRQVFESEIRDFLHALPGLFGNAHGDRVVAIALANPAANTASPLHVLATLRSMELPPGRLWTLFKECGGVSKEEGDHVDECDQLHVLSELWTRMMLTGSAG